MMNNLYSKLLTGVGSRKVKLRDTTVTAESHKGTTTAIVKSVYTFVGNTNISKETLNLIERKNNVVNLTKIEIIRKTHIKNVTINIRFLSDDDVLLFNESDANLLIMSDTNILDKLGIEIN